jgi:predicted dehydrogenase
MDSVLVLGTGSIGSRHLRVLERAGVRAIGLSVRGGERLANASDKGASAAVIATSTGRHLSDAEEGLALGCHLLVEKPLGASTTGLAALEAKAREAGRSVYVGCCLRFDVALLRFRELLPQIGTVHDVRIECQTYLPDWRPNTDYRASYSAKRDEGGVLRDLVHEIDYAAWLFGWPESLTARVGNTGRLGIEAEEWAELSWRALHATSVSLRLDYLTRPARRIMRAHGEKGSLAVDLIAHELVLELASSGAPHKEKLLQERDDMMLDQARAFLRAIQGGDAGTLATLEEGARALAICDAARESDGKPVVVRDWRAA